MRRLAGLVFGVVATGGALVGCGAVSPTALMVVTTAAVKTQAARTARISFSYGVQGQTVHVDGIADLTANQATFATKVPGLGSIEAIQNGTTIYEKLPGQLGTLAGKPWIKFDLAKALNKLTGVNAAFFSQTSTNSPTTELDYLRGASHDAQKVGTATLHGTQTSQYHATIDLRLAAMNAPNAARKAGLNQYAKVLGVNTFTVDVWIDSRGRLRQMRYSLDTSKFHLPTGIPEPTGTATYTFEFYDFGVPFSLPRLPSPGQVIDINQRAPGPASTPSSSGVPLSEAMVSAPTGFVSTTANDLPNGTIDAAQFAKFLGSKALAERFHFVTGFSQHSYDPSGATLEVTLLQFASPTAAASFDETAFAGLTSSNRMVATRNTALPASVELNSTKTDPSGNYEHTIIARKSNRVVVVDFFNALQERAPLIKTIAQQVYGRL